MKSQFKLGKEVVLKKFEKYIILKYFSTFIKNAILPSLIIEFI